jgi:hypothetical protein
MGDVQDKTPDGAVNSTQEKKECCFIMLIGLVLFSGFVAFGLHFLSSVEYSFIQKAHKVNADVIRVQYAQQHNLVGSSSIQNQAFNSKISVVEVHFEDFEGNGITTTLSDNEITTIREGDVIEILYNPENPKDTKFLKSEENAEFMRNLSRFFAIIFLCLSCVAIIRFKKKQKDEFCDINIGEGCT